MTASFPLQWPDGWPRTPATRRDRGDQFKRPGSSGLRDKTYTFTQARDLLLDELRRLGTSRPVISTNHPTGSHGLPLDLGRRTSDEGVAIYFTLNGRPMAMACDRFDNAAANMRSLGLAIEAMRQLERHGGGVMVERAFTGFVALPSNSPWNVLGLKPGASRDEIETAYREQAKTAHPDAGGSHDQMARLNAARADLLGQKP